MKSKDLCSTGLTKRRRVTLAISSNNDVTEQEPKDMVEIIIQNYVCFTLLIQNWLILLACFLGLGMLDGSIYSNGIFTDKMSQDLGVTEEQFKEQHLRKLSSLPLCVLLPASSRRNTNPKLLPVGGRC